MDRLTESEYIRIYGAERKVLDEEFEWARDALRKDAFNTSYIPPTNNDGIMFFLALMYKGKYEKSVNLLSDAKKELSALKRKKAS